MRGLTSILIALLAVTTVHAGEIHPPAQVTAGTAITIPSSGSGEATFYLIGPNAANINFLAA